MSTAIMFTNSYSLSPSDANDFQLIRQIFNSPIILRIHFNCLLLYEHMQAIFRIFCIMRYYNIQKIKRYQKLALRYDYTTGILLDTII